MNNRLQYIRTATSAGGQMIVCERLLKILCQLAQKLYRDRHPNFFENAARYRGAFAD